MCSLCRAPVSQVCEDTLVLLSFYHPLAGDPPLERRAQGKARTDAFFFALMLTTNSLISPPSRASSKTWVTATTSEMDIPQAQTAFPPCAEHRVIGIHFWLLHTPWDYFSREMLCPFPAGVRLFTLGLGLQNPAWGPEESIKTKPKRTFLLFSLI